MVCPGFNPEDRLDHLPIKRYISGSVGKMAIVFIDYLLDLTVPSVPFFIFYRCAKPIPPFFKNLSLMMP